MYTYANKFRSEAPVWEPRRYKLVATSLVVSVFKKDKMELFSLLTKWVWDGYNQPTEKCLQLIDTLTMH